MLEGGRDNRVRGPSRGEWSPWVVEPDQKTREGEVRRGEHLQVSNLHVPDGSSVAGAGGGRVVYLVGSRGPLGAGRWVKPSVTVRPGSGAILAPQGFSLK